MNSSNTNLQKQQQSTTRFGHPAQHSAINNHFLPNFLHRPQCLVTRLAESLAAARGLLPSLYPSLHPLLQPLLLHRIPRALGPRDRPLPGLQALSLPGQAALRTRV